MNDCNICHLLSHGYGPGWKKYSNQKKIFPYSSSADLHGPCWKKYSYQNEIFSHSSSAENTGLPKILDFT